MNLEKLENESELQYIWRICSAKDNGTINMYWEDLAEVMNENLCKDETEWLGESAYRKKYQYAKAFYDEVFSKMKSDSDDLDEKLSEIRKERMKLQTLNLERVRIERNEARHELFYEYVKDAIETLPVPEFKECNADSLKTMEYVLCLADIHYGATFKSTNNEYSPAICQERLEYLAGQVIEFIQEKKLDHINILELGDSIQNILRLSDLKINDSSVVKAIVQVSRLIALFLNKISEYAEINYYHVPSANHTQTRPLGSKASELADEDLEYVISNYIKDACKDNPRINVILAEEGSQYLKFELLGFNIIAGHGHTIRSKKTALRDLSMLDDCYYDYAILGHFHGGEMFTSNEGCVHDKEVIIANSFIGSDPYSDRLTTGSKAASLMLGFDELSGHTETYKFVLN